MTEETSDNSATEPAEADSGPRAGERLAAARREKQISVVEISKELHLDEHKVRALERNEFDAVGAPVFAKGYLRKYAQLVGVPVEDVLLDYYTLQPAEDMPPVVGPVRRPVRELHPGRWLLLLLVLAVIGSAYWWFFVREPSSPVPARDASRPTLPDAPPERVEPEPSESLSPPIAEPDPAAEASATPDAASRSPEPAVTAPATRADMAPGDVQVSIAYDGDCWTEITDAGGERLFFGLGAEGRTVSVSGAAPLSVLFGNADNVRLRVDGADYPIPATSRRGRTARFSIQAP